MSTLFHGLSAFPITPANAEGVVDADGVAAMVARLQGADVASIGLLGSTGTYAYLDRQQRRRAIEAAVAVGGSRPLIVGIGALRTDAAIALARDAAEAGADALLMAPMSYTPLHQDEAFEHYRRVAEATDLPLVIYNNPGTTHFTFSTRLLSRLGAVTNIAAVKMPLPDDTTADLSRLRPVLPDAFPIGYSGDWGAAETLLSGADAFYSVAGGLWPTEMGKLVAAARDGNRTETHRIDAAFAALWDLFRTAGSLRVVYTAARMLNLTTAEPPRPLLPHGDEEAVEAAMDALAAI